MMNNENRDSGEDPSVSQAATARSRESAAYGAMLFSTSVGDIVFPAFIFLLPLLAFQLGASAPEVGIVGGAANVVYCFMAYAMGRFSDRIGSRFFFITGSFALLTVVSLLDWLYPTPMSLIAFRLAEGVAWAMLYPALQAGVAELATRDPRKSLAAYNLAWSGSFAVGPLIMSALVFLTSIRFTFFIIAGLLFAALVVNLATMRGRRNAPVIEFEQEQNLVANSTVRKRDEESPFGKKNNLGNDAVLSLVMTAVAGAAVNIVFTFFPPMAKSLGLNVLVIGIVVFAYGAARFMTYLLFNSGRITTTMLEGVHRGRKVYVSVFVLCAACLLFLPVDRGGLLYVLASATVAVGFSINFAIAQSALIAEVPSSRKGFGAGMLESSVGAGGAIGPIIAGVVSGGSFALPFVVPIVGFAVAGLALSSRSSSYKERLKRIVDPSQRAVTPKRARVL